MPSLLCPAVESAGSRKLGPTEASYYLGSRGEGIEGGVNDMYLHIGFSAPANLVTKKRVLEVWSQILYRHPLLTATVELQDYTNIRFQAQEAGADKQEYHPRGQELCKFESGRDASAIISAYLNGPRTLSDDRLSQITVSTPEKDYDFSEGADDESLRDFDFFLFSTHFLGDGMALHSTAHEFFSLLSQGGPENGGVLTSPTQGLPPSMENQLEDATNRLPATAARVDFEREQARQIGGHAFRKARLGTRHTLVLTHSYSPEQTKRALSKCKVNGVSIANAMFTLSTFAYLRSTTLDQSSPELPIMLYSALNVRPFLKKTKSQPDWYHIAIGYYNITLPAFFPSTISPSATFWLRAQSVKKQTNQVVKSPFLISRTLCMAKKREAQSIQWEREADAKKKEKEQRLVASQNGRNPEESSLSAGKGAHSSADDTNGANNQQNGLGSATSTNKAPQTALMGLSMLGNLDGIYQHANYAGIELHSLTTGSRQRPGALLLFAYTFAGKLWISLGYDSNGFERGVIDGWWKELLGGVDEFLLSDGGSRARPSPIGAERSGGGERVR